MNTPTFTRTILIITHVVPFHPAAGNEIRILHLAKWLKRKGYRIILLLKAEEIAPEVRKGLKGIFEEIYLGGDNRPGSTLNKLLFWTKTKNRPISPKEAMAPDSLVRKAGHLCLKYRPFAVFAEYIFMARCLDHTPPGTLKIIDTHDMFSRKQNLVEIHGIKDPFSCTEEEERAYLLKSDLILAIQKNEEEMLKKLVPERKVITTEIDFNVAGEIDNGTIVPGTILVVGSDNPLNIHGLREFINHSWPTVCQQAFKATLRIVGKVAYHIDAEGPSIIKLGWVPDLTEEYRRAAIVINPTVAGTGLKIKSVEALCQGKVLIGTPNSVDGLHYEGSAPFVIARDWEEFSAKTLLLLSDEDARMALQKKALLYSADTFNAEQVYASLASALKGFEVSLLGEGRMS